MGTGDGLNRYDGYGFKIYRHYIQDSLSLAGNLVRSLFIESKRNQWVGAGGLNLYDRNRDCFIRVVTADQIDNGSMNIEIEDITENGNGDLWFYVKNLGLSPGECAYKP